MKHFSVDLRERIIAAYKLDPTILRIAEQFSVSRCSVMRYIKLDKNGDSLEPKPRSGRNRKLTEEQYELVRQQVVEHPEYTLVEHAALLAEAGINISFKTVDRIFTRLGITQKKDGTGHRTLE